MRPMEMPARSPTDATAASGGTIVCYGDYRAAYTLSTKTFGNYQFAT